MFSIYYLLMSIEVAFLITKKKIIKTSQTHFSKFFCKTDLTDCQLIELYINGPDFDEVSNYLIFVLDVFFRF